MQLKIYTFYILIQPDDKLITAETYGCWFIQQIYVVLKGYIYIYIYIYIVRDVSNLN
jgi:hypothetical protein